MKDPRFRQYHSITKRPGEPGERREIMRIITEEYLRKLAWKGLLDINEKTRTDKECTVRWVWGEDEHLLITQNK
jgi:hypothetical protein